MLSVRMVVVMTDAMFTGEKLENFVFKVIFNIRDQSERIVFIDNVIITDIVHFSSRVQVEALS